MPGSSVDVLYVETDIPSGVTISDWCAQRARERAAEQEARRQSSRTRTLIAAVAAPLRDLGRRLLANARRGPRRPRHPEVPA